MGIQPTTQPGCESWPAIESVTSWCTGRRPTNRATRARATKAILISPWGKADPRETAQKIHPVVVTHTFGENYSSREQDNGVLWLDQSVPSLLPCIHSNTFPAMRGCDATNFASYCGTTGRYVCRGFPHPKPYMYSILLNVFIEPTKEECMDMQSGPSGLPFYEFRSNCQLPGACFSSVTLILTSQRAFPDLQHEKSTHWKFQFKKRLAFQVNSAYLTQSLIQHIFTEHLIHTCSQGSCSLVYRSFIRETCSLPWVFFWLLPDYCTCQDRGRKAS